MNVLVPIQVEIKEDKCCVRLPFDSEFIVERKTLDLALQEVTASISPSIQLEKAISLIEKIKEYQNQHDEFLKIDFFSKGEHRIMCGMLFLSLFSIYLLFGSTMNCLWAYYYSPFAYQSFSPKLIPIFSSNMATLGVFRICFFLLLWTLTYSYIYPRILKVYSQILMQNEGMKKLHKSIVTKFSFLKNSNYDLKEKLS
ncbi:hypothetical protein MJH12_18150 [bacterium]|nr:hypothetical protein [bacterium]